MIYPKRAHMWLDLDGEKWAHQLETLGHALKYVSDFDLAVDCGAFVGTWAGKMLEHFKEVVAFEPVAENFRCLLENVPGALAYNLALGDGATTVGLGVSGAGYGSVMNKGNAEPYPCVTLDAYDLSPGLIKIDVDGMDAAVIRGAVETIHRSNPVLIVEQKLGAFMDGTKESASLLRGLGYHAVEYHKPDAIWIKE